MKHEEKIIGLIENAFRNLASPAKRFGLYAEIEKAVREAYEMGKQHKAVEIPLTLSENLFLPSRA